MVGGHSTELFLILATVAFFCHTSTAQVSPLAKEIMAAMDTSVDPCKDFYQYACGGWIKSHPLPPDESAIFKAFTTIGDFNNAVLKKIVETKQTGEYEKVTTMFDACMDTNAANKLRATPLNPYFQEIKGVKDFSTFMEQVGRLQRSGFPPLFSSGSGIDAKDPTKNIAQFSQGGIAMPSRTLYLANDQGTQEIRNLYTDYVTQSFVLLGESNATATKHALQVLAVETAIANASLPDDALIDPFATYNKLDIAGLKKISPNLDWDRYLHGLGYPDMTEINVVVPDFFANLSRSFAKEFGAEELQSYLRFNTLNQVASALSQDFRNNSFNFFGVVISGQQEPAPRWEQCISTVDSTVGELLGALYVQAAFTQNDLNTAEAMIQSIEDAMHEDLLNITWMDSVTRQRALQKLGLVGNQVGYPAHPQTYSNYHFRPDTLAANLIQAASLSFIKQMDGVGKKADRNAWEMTADTINAYYDPTKNQMVFPAGILQSPYFNGSHPMPMNYGGAGVIMGHELTHGFDNQGKDYNGEGLLTDWWQKATEDKFNAKVQCIINQYSQFEVLPGLYLNGQTTQGENIADCGGTKNSHAAYLKKAGASAREPSIVPGLTNEHLFFVAYAQGWCSVASDAYLRNQVQTDPHSTAKFRVLGPLMNLEPFADVWKCPVGSYMNPANRCSVW